MLVNKSIDGFGYLLVLVAIVRGFIHIKVVSRNYTFCNMASYTVR
jgi:hypothetical protein